MITLAGVALLSATFGALPTRASDDIGTIRALISKTWDKPEAKVESDPVVMDGSYAVASWTQGQYGGRALLRKDGETWVVVLCSGDGLKDAKGLTEAGVPARHAEALAIKLSAAEESVPAERRKLFSLFGEQGAPETSSGDADHAGHHKPHH